MAIVTATGTPFASGYFNAGPSGTMQLIVPRYAKTVLRKLYPMTMAPTLCSHDHEGEIKQYGASMTIRKRSNVAMSPYMPGQLVQVTNLADVAAFTFNIDKAIQWAFPFDQVTLQQTDLKQYPQEMVDDALHNSATAIDTDFFANVYSYADSANYGATAGAKSKTINLGTAAAPLTVSNDTVVGKLVDARTTLKENNVTQVGDTWVVLPPAITGTMLQANLLQSIYSGRPRSPLVEEDGIDPETTVKALGSLGGFTSIYESNLLYQGAKGEYYCPFGATQGIQFAAQIGFAESLKNPNAFGDIHRGLNVWGWGVSIPAMLGYIVLLPASTPSAG